MIEQLSFDVAFPFMSEIVLVYPFLTRRMNYITVEKPWGKCDDE